MDNHVHISALQGVIVMLYVIVGLGTLHAFARKFPDSALSNAILDVIA